MQKNAKFSVQIEAATKEVEEVVEALMKAPIESSILNQQKEQRPFLQLREQSC